MSQSEQLTQTEESTVEETRHVYAPEEVFETTPTIRPVLVWAGLTLFIGGAILAFIYANPTLLGDPRLTEIFYWAILLLVIATILRFAVKMFILTRTEYVVTPDDIRREYELLYRRKARELPLEKIRGIEYSQNRIQSLMGYGTLSFLAGGTNQSLGFVEFENLRDPDVARRRIRRFVKEHTA